MKGRANDYHNFIYMIKPDKKINWIGRDFIKHIDRLSVQHPQNDKGSPYSLHRMTISIATQSECNVSPAGWFYYRMDVVLVARKSQKSMRPIYLRHLLEEYHVSKL